MRSLPLHRVHAVPPECRKAFLWLMDSCKEFGIDVSNVIFTADEAGGFVKAEGNLTLGDCVGKFLVTESDGTMTVYVNKNFRLHNNHNGTDWAMRDLAQELDGMGLD